MNQSQLSDAASRCRLLRQESTDAERLHWQCLRGRQLGGAKFRRQHPIGCFIVDFYCHEASLAIELDGGHHGDSARADQDRDRTLQLEALGIKVLRFWNNEVFENLEGVVETVLEALTPTLSRRERG